MARSLLGGSSSNNNATKYFDIRLDNDYIVFKGGPNEASGVHAQGSIVLCLSEPLTVKHLKLTLSGMNRSSWYISSSSAMTGKKTIHRERTFYEKSWVFIDPGKSKTDILKPGNYEYPFDILLEGSLPESVEGLDHSWIVYRFKAEIGKKYQKDISVRRPLRIVRTLDADTLHLAHSMSVENTWVDKIDYSMSTPSKVVMFGSAIQVDFRLVPLLKGLVVGMASVQLREEIEVTPDAELGVNACNTKLTDDRLITKDEYHVDSGSPAQVLDEEAEGYRFSRYLELPKTLNKCMQDCETKGIRIRHKLKFNIQLHNPDGHVSELRANLPIALYISPALPINENNDLVDQTPHANRQAMANDVALAAPPMYGQHQLDVLYADVDPSGYRTPGGLSTPATPYTPNRNASTENLSSLGVITGVGLSPSGHHLNPDVLQSRLQNLNIRGETTIPTSSLAHDDLPPDNLGSVAPEMRRTSSGVREYLSMNGSGSQVDGSSPQYLPNGFPSLPGSNAVSRRPSGEEQQYSSHPASGTHSPRSQILQNDDLLRVPSYTTAVKTPAPRTQTTAGLPSYSATTSVTGPAEPPSAHVRDRPGQANRPANVIQDEERRLQMMRSQRR